MHQIDKHEFVIKQPIEFSLAIYKSASVALLPVD